MICDTTYVTFDTRNVTSGMCVQVMTLEVESASFHAQRQKLEDSYRNFYLGADNFPYPTQGVGRGLWTSLCGLFVPPYSHACGDVLHGNALH